jgi:6-pyruvoyltetrahydropterin/6-carboxytetrahydropterin synthase
MYSIKVEGNFSSAHNLRGYKGKCEDLHGHNWKVEVLVASAKLDKIGMVMDFKFVKKSLADILERLDHKYLNKLDYFKRVNPTSENIARYIFDKLRSRLPQMVSVTVWENPASRATYDEK